MPTIQYSIRTAKFVVFESRKDQWNGSVMHAQSLSDTPTDKTFPLFNVTFFPLVSRLVISAPVIIRMLWAEYHASSAFSSPR